MGNHHFGRIALRGIWNFAVQKLPKVDRELLIQEGQLLERGFESGEAVLILAEDLEKFVARNRGELEAALTRCNSRPTRLSIDYPLPSWHIHLDKPCPRCFGSEGLYLQLPCSHHHSYELTCNDCQRHQHWVSRSQGEVGRQVLKRGRTFIWGKDKQRKWTREGY